MGREIRRVPVDFEHPYDRHGNLQSMFDQTLAEADAEWEEELAQLLASGELDEVWTQAELDRMLAECNEWERKEILALKVGDKKMSLDDYIGEKPSERSEEYRAFYRPDDWPPEDERGWVVYQTVSEGTPVTPCFATRDELWLHLVNHGTIADPPMSREAAQRFIDDEWVPSAIGSGGVIRSGLAALEPDAFAS